MSRRLCCLLLVLAVAATASAQKRERMKTERQPAPPHIEKAMAELWRRGVCLLSSVLKPAARESVVPSGIGQTPVLHPRVIGRTGEVLCYAVDGQGIWASDDRCLWRIDAAGGKVAGRYDLSAGLADSPIQSIAPAGKAVWLATRGGLVRLDAATGGAAAPAQPAFQVGRLAAAGGGDVWLVSDAGAFRLPAEAETWQKLPDFPGQTQLAQIARGGIWAPQWSGKLRALLPAVFANADGLYVICLNRLSRCDAAGGKWQAIAADAWRASPHGRKVWALTTTGCLCYDAADGKTVRHEAGKGPAAGRPAALAVADKAVFLATEPDYDAKAKAFAGGGISRLDLAAGNWTVADRVDGLDVRFAGALLAEGDEAWAACTLYDGVVELGAHPGMAHLKRWRPRLTGLGLLHCAGGKWSLLKTEPPKPDRRWVMGQKGTVSQDDIVPMQGEILVRCGDELWGAWRMFPRRYYAGYSISAGRLAARQGGRWQGRVDICTAELGLAGEQPELMLISHSHGEDIVLAEGHPVVLGVECVGGRACVIAESGVFVRDAAADRFTPVIAEPVRVYWRATCAAAGPSAVWFGGDGGTVSRYDRKTGRLELVGVAEGRKIAAMVATPDGVAVRTAKADVALPVSLASAPRLPAGETATYRDGKGWSAEPAAFPALKPVWAFDSKSNYLLAGGKRVAFVPEIFRPVVLCEDPVGKRLWLGGYSGVAWVPLPEGR